MKYRLVNQNHLHQGNEKRHLPARAPDQLGKYYPGQKKLSVLLYSTVDLMVVGQTKIVSQNN